MHVMDKARTSTEDNPCVERKIPADRPPLHIRQMLDRTSTVAESSVRTPTLSSRLTGRLVIGVFSGYAMCRPVLICPPALPASSNAQVRVLMEVGIAKAPPYRITEWSRRDPSFDARDIGHHTTWRPERSVCGTRSGSADQVRAGDAVATHRRAASSACDWIQTAPFQHGSTGGRQHEID